MSWREGNRVLDHQDESSSPSLTVNFVLHRENTINTLTNRARDYRTIDITCQGRPEPSRRSRKDLFRAADDRTYWILSPWRRVPRVGQFLNWCLGPISKMPGPATSGCALPPGKHLILRSASEGETEWVRGVYNAARKRLCSRGNLNSQCKSGAAESAEGSVGRRATTHDQRVFIALMDKLDGVILPQEEPRTLLTAWLATDEPVVHLIAPGSILWCK